MEAPAPVDPEIAALLDREHARQNIMIQLIPSQSMVGEAILEAKGSILSNLAIEGHPRQWYFPGCNLADEVVGYESRPTWEGNQHGQSGLEMVLASPLCD